MNWVTAIVVLPTDETKERLRDILSQSPIEINFDSISIQIAKSSRSTVGWQSNPEAYYEGRFLNFGLKYNEVLGYVQLVGEFDCPELSARMNEFVQSWEEQIPVVMFNHMSPPLGNTNKSFLASVSNTLASKEEKPFTFQGEVRIDRK